MPSLTLLRRVPVRGLALLFLLALATPTPGEAQLGGLKNKLKQKVEDVKNSAGNAAEDAVVCVVTDTECIATAKEQGQEVSYTDEDGNPVPPPAEGTPGPGAPTTAPGEGAWANFDFVPGERVIFAEDFTKERVGNFPRRLTFHDGNLEVVEWQGRRWLRANPSGVFEVPLPETLPEKFTLEYDVTLPWAGSRVFGTPYDPNAWEDTDFIQVDASILGIVRANRTGEATMDPTNLDPAIEAALSDGWLSPPVRVRVMADGAYVKVYMNEHRVSNMPNAAFPRTNSLTFFFHDNSGDGTRNWGPLITNIVVSASDVTMYDALAADGRVAVQGILFDTGSDRIRPESSGTLAEIAAMMDEHADLALTIEGHTDNVGDAAANQALSERRAAAVKQILVSSYGIDAGRLDAAGFGASKPAADNATPEGRQQNRRVELVRRSPS